MYRIHPAYVLWVMEELLEGRVRNEITVPENIRREALVSLDRMLSLR
jgi:quinolinate synthase